YIEECSAVLKYYEKRLELMQEQAENLPEGDRQKYEDKIEIIKIQLTEAMNKNKKLKSKGNSDWTESRDQMHESLNDLALSFAKAGVHYKRY
ncbi:MAG: hypothetical protein ACLFQV_12800, partial [Vulcanimicrobiota bacterium]